MKNVITICLVTLTCISYAMSSNDSLTHDSKSGIEGITHFGTVPYYTPFISMFQTETSSGDVEWSVAFAMIIGVGDTIFVEDQKATSACRGNDCKKYWKVNVYSKNSTSGAKGTKLESLLFQRGTELRRESISYDGKPFQLATFIIRLDGNDPKNSPYRVVIGEHPHVHRINKVHEGGAIHWPTGS